VFDFDPMVSYPQSQFSLVVPDLQFDSGRPRVAECIPRGFTRNSVKIITQNRRQMPRRAFQQNIERRRGFARFGIGVSCAEFLAQGRERVDQVAAVDLAAP